MCSFNNSRNSKASMLLLLIEVIDYYSRSSSRKRSLGSSTCSNDSITYKRSILNRGRITLVKDTCSSTNNVNARSLGGINSNSRNAVKRSSEDERCINRNSATSKSNSSYDSKSNLAISNEHRSFRVFSDSKNLCKTNSANKIL